MAKEQPRNSKFETVRNVLRQLIREMWIPGLIAVAWTIYSLIGTPEKQNVVDAITVFGGSFFLACWAFAQWFRVKKQQAVESGLGSIVQKQEALITALEDTAERLEGHASGGKSFAWLSLTNYGSNVISNITANVVGKYPLLDARASVSDMSKLEESIEAVRMSGRIQDFHKFRVNFSLGTLRPKLAHLQNSVIPCDSSQPSLRFVVEWYARNGTWLQFVELKKNGEKYDTYTAVQRDDEWVFEQPSRDLIPKQPDGKPDVFWHDKLK